MALALTARQAQILKLIERSIVETGFPPTRAEIAQQLGFKSPNAAEDHLRALARKGYVEIKAGTSRGIRLLQSSGQYENPLTGTTLNLATDTLDQISLPLIGRVAAGSPILAQENIVREYAIQTTLFETRPDYLLTVKGLSMRNIGILDGDLLAIKKAQEARSGSIVVARIDDDVTVKRLLLEKNKVTLLPENEDFEPIEVRAGEEFAIEGLVVGLIRPHALH